MVTVAGWGDNPIPRFIVTSAEVTTNEVFFFGLVEQGESRHTPPRFILRPIQEESDSLDRSDPQILKSMIFAPKAKS